MIRDVIEEPLVALAAFDVCLLTSIAEGTSNVALEAQWIGTPVVATAGGGTQESLDIGASGWLIDQPDADTIADVVLRVLADPKCKSTAAERGPRFIASRFGTDRMISGNDAALWACPRNRFDPDLIMMRVMERASSRAFRNHAGVPRQYLVPSRPPHR